MKKIFALLLAALLLSSSLLGCSSKRLSGIPKDLKGTEAAKLLLAAERLDAQLLQNEGDIFENGVEVMNGLAEKAIANLQVSHVEIPAAVLMNLSAVQNLSTILEGEQMGKVVIDGDTVTFSDFKENNNSYDYFLNLTQNIVTSAEIGANLIDHVKKNVRVTDKWVDMDGMRYYLRVSENEEILYEWDTRDEAVHICRRFKNEAGLDVYELYRKSDKFAERMTYIPGVRYEISMINEHGEHQEDYFTADHSKGYWETYVLGVAPEHYNVSYFIMKNDICYDAFYAPESGEIPMLKVMSADRATDIFNIGQGYVDLKFSGFDGIDRVVAPLSDVEYNAQDQYANMGYSERAVLYLTNGKTIRMGDTFVDGKVSVSAIRVSYIGMTGYIGELSLNIQCETREETAEALAATIREIGLQCRRDLNSVLAGIDRAYADVDNIIRYYRWNGVLVTDNGAIAEAITVEKSRFDVMEDLYLSVKDAEVIDYNDTKAMELNIQFAPIVAQTDENAVYDAMTVSVGSISLTINDTALYVQNEPYQIMLALLDVKHGGLIHLPIENPDRVNYAGEQEFTVTAGELRFDLPALEAGEYTVVAYIATSDGIRASAYTAVGFDTVSYALWQIDQTEITAERTGEGNISISYTESEDICITLTAGTAPDHAAFRELVLAEVFRYGMPSDSAIEQKVGEEFVALTGAESAIESGMYRLGYTLQNGDAVTKGYVYIDLRIGT